MNADTHSWEKRYVEGRQGELPSEQFYAAILNAVAEHYAVDLAEVTDAKYTADQVLTMLIDQLRANGHLQNLASDETDNENADS